MVELWDKTADDSNLGIFGSTVERLLRIQEMAGLPLDREKAHELAAVEDRLVGDHCKVYEDTVECLDQLQQRGFALAIHTNCSPSVLEFLNSSGLTKYFDIIGLSFQMRLLKPQQESYNWITSKIGVPATSCVFVGDGNNQELTGAKQAGMVPVRISRPGAAISNQEGHEFSISKLSELFELLDSYELSERRIDPNKPMQATRYPRASRGPLG